MKTGRLYPIVMLALLVLITYCRAIYNGFVLDDLHYLLGMDVYSQFDVVRIFTTLANGIEYLPVRDLTLAIDYAIAGENAAWLHFSSVLYFLVTVCTVYYLTIEIIEFIGKPRSQDGSCPNVLPLFAAALFAVHPINGEAVNAISSRNVVLGGLFFFLSTLYYLKSVNHPQQWYKWYSASLICFLLALLSKATPIILPAVLFVTMMVFTEKRRRHALLLAPFFALSVIFLFVLTEVGKHAKIISQTASVSVLTKISVAAQIPFFYIWKFLYPSGFTTHYSIDFSTGFVTPTVLLAITAISALIVIAFACRHKSPAMTFGILWFILSLVPVLNFYSTYPVVSDRYAFIPVYGLCLMSSVSMLQCASVWRMAARYSIALAVVFVFAVISFYRIGYWKDEKSIWGITVSNSPEHIAGYVGLGAAYFSEGNYEKAIEYYARTRNLSPPNVMYEIALGQYYTIKGEQENAIRTFKQALQRKPDATGALYALGDIYLGRGDTERARSYFLKVFDSRESNPQLVVKTEKKLKLMFAGEQSGIEALMETLGKEPDNLDMRGNVALKLDSMGLYDEALKHYLEMERQGMSKWQLWYNIGNVYKKKKILPEAATYFRKSLKANPDNVDALNNLGVVCRDMKEYGEAIASLKRAISINPLFSYAPLNLAITYRRMGDTENALRFFEYTKSRFPDLSADVESYMKE